MNVIIRADSSTNIGSGHVMRCLTLADGLSENGAKVSFICQDLLGSLNTFIEERGYPVHTLLPETKAWQQDAKGTIHYIEQQTHKPDWLIVDHYDLGSEWEKYLRPYTSKILVIDDLADRSHDCDVLLDQNYYSDLNERYADLVSANSTMLLGPKYALLREEFGKNRKCLKEKSGDINRVLVSLGAGDPDNLTSTVIDVLVGLKLSLDIDVVIGKSNPHKEILIKKCKNLPAVDLHIQTSNMADLMANADFAVGAGGSTSWERCALGLPSLLISLAENQVRISEGLSELGAAFYIGKHEEVTELKLASFLERIISDYKVIKKMVKNCINTVDAQGCRRVVAVLESQI